MDNNYAAPNADLAVEGETKEIPFVRFSAWGVFGLSLITGGFYTAYWLYDRSKTLNEHVDNPISSTLITANILFGVASLAVNILSNTATLSDDMALLLSLVALTSGIVSLVLTFKFRNRFADTFLNERREAHAVLTFFFNAIYMQYKINQKIDQG